MLVVLSPAKKLDWRARSLPQMASVPRFQTDAVYLAREAHALGAEGLKKLMKISDALATLNHDRFAEFAQDPNGERTRPAIHAFAGDTYTGLDAASLDADALDWAERHLRILSGLYGLLRPFDAIQPYRLEMGSRLATREGASLYDYWGTRIAEALDEAAREANTDFVVNCASQEYFSAVARKTLRARVIAPVFKEQRDGAEPRVLSFFAKKARGAMARFILEGRLREPADLEAFDTAGYRYAPELSSEDSPVFLRDI